MACTSHPAFTDGSVRLEVGHGAAAVAVDLDDVAPTVDQLVVALRFVGSTANDLRAAHAGVVCDDEEVLAYPLGQSIHHGERALVVFQLYRREGWRIGVVDQGYVAGMHTLLDQYQGHGAHDLFPADEWRPDADIESDDHGGGPAGGDGTTADGGPKRAATVELTNPWRVELVQRLESEAPALFSLARLAGVSLEQHGLVDHAAKVALCLDISLSMDGLYRSGKIQRFAEKILALGTLFDDDGDIDVFLFGLHAHDVGAMNLDNWQGFVDSLRQRYPLEAGTYYGEAMTEIRRHYFGVAAERDEPTRGDHPIYVMFVTDGMTADQELAEEMLRWSSYEPIFWQFMAIGKVAPPLPKGRRRRGRRQETPVYGNDFTFLQMLDDLPDRYVDNAAFFSVEDPEDISTERLYELMMVEYPGWVRMAPALRLLELPAGPVVPAEGAEPIGSPASGEG